MKRCASWDRKGKGQKPKQKRKKEKKTRETNPGISSRKTRWMGRWSRANGVCKGRVICLPKNLPCGRPLGEAEHDISLFSPLNISFLSLLPFPASFFSFLTLKNCQETELSFSKNTILLAEMHHMVEIWTEQMLISVDGFRFYVEGGESMAHPKRERAAAHSCQESIPVARGAFLESIFGVSFLSFHPLLFYLRKRFFCSNTIFARN